MRRDILPALAMALLLFAAGVSRARLGPIKGFWLPHPLNAVIADPTTFERAPVLCVGTPVETVEVKASGLPEAIRKEGPDESWRVTRLKIAMTVRGRIQEEIIRIAHFRTEGWPEHAITDAGKQQLFFLVALLGPHDGTFFARTVGAELPLQLKPGELPDLDPARQSETEMLDTICAEAAARGDDRTAAGVILSTRFWENWMGLTPLLHAQALRLSDSENPDLKLIALDWLITRDSPGVLETWKAFRDSKPELSADTARFIRIPNAIEAHVRDPRAIPILAEFAAGDDTQLRDVAVYCLREIGAPEVVPVLAQGLYSDDLDYRYNCLIGLAQATGRRFSESTTNRLGFLGNPEPLTTKWREWWETEGKKKYAPRENAARQ